MKEWHKDNHQIKVNNRQRTQSQTKDCRSNQNMEASEELMTNTNRSRQSQTRRQIRSNRSRNSK